MKFKAIMNGTYRPMVINSRFREAWEVITNIADTVVRLAEQVAELQDAAGIAPEGVTLSELLMEAPAPVDVTTTNSGDGLPGDAPTDATVSAGDTTAPEGAPAFDWKTSESVEALKAFALNDLGLTIRKQKVSTVRAEIQSFLEMHLED